MLVLFFAFLAIADAAIIAYLWIATKPEESSEHSNAIYQANEIDLHLNEMRIKHGIDLQNTRNFDLVRSCTAHDHCFVAEG